MSALDRYILDERRNPVPEPDLTAWARWYGDIEARRVDRTELSGDISVSTVFLGTDHNFFGTGPPLLFESMVFGGEFDSWCERWSTWQEAADGHAAIVNAIRKGIPPMDWESSRG